MNFIQQFFWVIATPALAQVDTGINQVGEQIALGGADLRLVIARIINVALGFLGIVAVVLILYGGLVWMTSGGDEEKITKAENILVSAVIGLAIILSSYAIARFVINRLVEATGGREVPTDDRGGGGGSGGLPSGSFVVRSLQPNGSVPIRNVTVRAVMNLPVDAESARAPGAVTVVDTRNNAEVTGTVSVRDSVVEFVPTASCPPPNADRKCFDADVTYRITVAPPLQSSSGRTLLCGGIAPSCTGTFTTGNLVDVAAPSSVEILDPDAGAQVSAEAIVPIQVRAVDDAGISYITVSADNQSVGTAEPPAPTRDFTGVADWDTAGVTEGTHTLGAEGFDIDANSTKATPVSVTVRPAHCFDGIQNDGESGPDCGGGGCGACAGGSCVGNGDCASGICRVGQCVQVPEIRSVTPNDGGPGTFVTIQGAHFGTTAGRVTIGGVAAATCSTESWTDSAIIVVVPQGAANGPIEVRAANGESDRTDDARGPIIPDFQVNQTVHPGLCGVNPSRGRSGDSVALTGQNLGTDRGSVVFSLSGSDRVAPTPSEWGPTVIRAAVANISVSRESRGTVRARTVAAGDSNPLPFLFLPPESGGAPRIIGIDPANSAVGDAVTITGENFGNIAGTVIFTLPDGTAVVGDANFPPACSDRFWTNTTITIKVPQTELGAQKVKVRRNDAAESNEVDFTVTNDPPRPALCLLEPDNGPVGTLVDLFGDRFGVARDAVRFFDNQNADAIAAWGNQSVRDARVPAGARSGPVRVVVGGRESNPLPFSVGACQSDASCREGRVCCGDGVCRESCAEVGRSGGLAYRFSTGDIPRVPQVVESATCLGEVQSPSPFKNADDACMNAVIGARFTTDMEPGTMIASNVTVKTCNTGDVFDPRACRSDLALSRVSYVEGVRLLTIEHAPFATSTWYEVTLKSGGMADLEGQALDGDRDGDVGGNYVWKFRTSEGGACAVDHVELSPARSVITEQGGTQDLRADPTAANCNRLDCKAFPWDWSAALRDPIAPAGLFTRFTDIPDAPRCEQRATGLRETELENPLIVRAETSDERFDTAELNIRFRRPEVTDFWPGCREACREAEVGASFNISMDDATINPATVKIFSCMNESCRTFEDPGGVRGAGIIHRFDADDRVIGFAFAGVALERNHYYRVVISGGRSGVLSASGAVLANPNEGPDFTWIFKTKEDVAGCSVARVEVSPPRANVYVIGDTAHYGTVAFGSPDSCEPETGQRLNTLSYSWNWTAATTDAVIPPDRGPLPVVASVDFDPAGGKDILPLGVGNRRGPGCTLQCVRAGTLPNVSVCGDGDRERGEDCDDGNVTPGDGCSSVCLHEGTSLPACGNRAPDVGEDCDDGNTRDGDGCSSRCLNEGSLAGASICGNGDIGDGEDCDDGDRGSGDGCSSDCINEGSVPGPVSVCGNRRIESGEDCDDGNLVAGDGCTARCLAEGTPACVGPGDRVCCGNGDPSDPRRLVDISETCDDGNTRDGDGCSSRCLLEGSSSRYGLSFETASFCGSPIVFAPARPPLQTGEACEFVGPTDGRLDPDASVRAEFGGTSRITASTRNAAGATVSGTATFNTVCACTSDASCDALIPPSRIPMQGVGCGIGACCYGRPFVELASRAPGDGEADICRNALVTFNFNEQMDAASVVAAVSVAEADGDAAQGEVSAVDITEGGRQKTRVEFHPREAFAVRATYRVTVRETAMSARGVGLRAPISWTFTTGADICTLDLVTVDPTSWLFSAGGASREFVAHARTRTGSGETPEISPIPAVYDWAWRWSSSDRDARRVVLTPSDRTIATVATPPNPQNGTATVSAFARITANILGPERPTVAGAALVTVLLCENPWPARNPDGSWAPFTHDPLNFSTYYCRDAGNAADRADDLPEPTFATAEGTPYLFDLILPMNCGSGADDLCRDGDAVGVRVAQNGAHESPLRWYAAQAFGGSPSTRAIDGYEAIQEGRTVYIAAGNKVGDPTIYTNIYLVTYNEGASDALRGIYDQMLANISLNTNLVRANARVCSGNLERACSSDAECQPDAGVCLSPKDKLTRDVKRLADIKEIETALERYYVTNQKCSGFGAACLTDANCPTGESCVGSYPGLEAGSYLRGLSSSRWPSWQSTLGNALGFAVPRDPLNVTHACPEGSESETCFNPGTSTYQCSPYSSLYHYLKLGRGYEVGLNAELRFCTGTSSVCRTDADCGRTRSCGLPTWAPAVDVRDHEVGATRIDNFVDLIFCPDTRSFGAGQVCGDGAVGPGEQCEPGQSRVQACAGEGGRRGYRREACTDSCQFDTTGSCAVGSCGDGAVQEDAGEICDDGARNGSYGRCAEDCRSYAAHCGDGTRQAAEERCDVGGRCSADPAVVCFNLFGESADAMCARFGAGRCLGATRYSRAAENSCSFDCRAAGPFCGDRVVSAEYGEECEVGQTESSIEGCPIVPDPEGRPRQQSKHRTCTASCGWSPWGACGTGDSCGDGVVQAAAGEECDDGNRNDEDSCTRLCRRNVCGDGLVNIGREACDDGTRNVRPDDNGEIGRRRDACPYGQICNYCTTLCTQSTVSGPTCGDRAINGPEICEVEVARSSWLPADVDYSDQSFCAADCRTACPPTYNATPISFRAKRLDDPRFYQNRFVNEVVIRPSDEQKWGMSIPACRVAESSPATVRANVTLTERPELSVVFVADLSQGMSGCSVALVGDPPRCPPGAPTKLDVAKRSIDTAIDRLLDTYPSDRIHIGIVGFSSSNYTKNSICSQQPPPPNDTTYCSLHSSDAEEELDCPGGANVCRNDGRRPPGIWPWFDAVPPTDGDPWNDHSAVAATTDLGGVPILLDGSRRATLHAAVGSLDYRNTDYAAMGIKRAQEVLTGARGKRLIVFLSDGESKCGDPGRYPGDEGTPVCYKSRSPEIASITEPLASMAAEDAKADSEGGDPIRIFTVALLPDNQCLTSNAARQMRNRSSECLNLGAFRDADGLRWTGDAWEPGSGVYGDAACVDFDEPGYFKFSYCGTDLEGMYRNITDALVTFAVEVEDEAEGRVAITSPVREGLAQTITLPVTFACDPLRGKDLALRLRSPVDLAVRFADVNFNICRP